MSCLANVNSDKNCKTFTTYLTCQEISDSCLLADDDKSSRALLQAQVDKASEFEGTDFTDGNVDVRIQTGSPCAVLVACVP